MSECVRRCHFYIFTLTFNLSLLLKSKFFINNRGFADRYEKNVKVRANEEITYTTIC